MNEIVKLVTDKAEKTVARTNKIHLLFAMIFRELLAFSRFSADDDFLALKIRNYISLDDAHVQQAINDS